MAKLVKVDTDTYNNFIRRYKDMLIMGASFTDTDGTDPIGIGIPYQETYYIIPGIDEDICKVESRRTSKSDDWSHTCYINELYIKK